MNVTADDRDARIAQLEAEAAVGRMLLRVLGHEAEQEAIALDEIANLVAQACSADDSLIALINGSTLRPFAHSNACAELPTGLRIPLRRTMPMTLAAAARRTIHVPDLDAASEADYPDIRRVEWVGTARTMLTAPLLHGKRTFGIVCARRRESRPFSESEIGSLERLADQLSSALACKAAIQAIIEQRDRSLQYMHTSVAKMSHELRTRINAIIGYSEMLQEEAEDLGEDAFIPDLQKVNAAGKHLLGLINDILDPPRTEGFGPEDFKIEVTGGPDSHVDSRERATPSEQAEPPEDAR